MVESNNRNKLKPTKGIGGPIISSNGTSSYLIMQDVLSIKSYLHKLSRILQVRTEQLIW